jgi:hypothetical protein
MMAYSAQNASSGKSRERLPAAISGWTTQTSTGTLVNRQKGAIVPWPLDAENKEYGANRKISATTDAVVTRSGARNGRIP